MGPLGVVEDEPVGEFLIEEGEIGKEQVFIVIDEGLLKGALQVRGGRSSWGIWGRCTSAGCSLAGFGQSLPRIWSRYQTARSEVAKAAG